MVRIKRIYEEPGPADGRRLLVDRLWPRGVSREKARLDGWLKEIAPSDELRSWFAHDPSRWLEFQKRYREELKVQSRLVEELRAQAAREPVTLLYAARDPEHNNAVVLRGVLSR